MLDEDYPILLSVQQAEIELASMRQSAALSRNTVAEESTQAALRDAELKVTALADELKRTRASVADRLPMLDAERQKAQTRLAKRQAVLAELERQREPVAAERDAAYQSLGEQLFAEIEADIREREQHIARLESELRASTTNLAHASEVAARQLKGWPALERLAHKRYSPPPQPKDDEVSQILAAWFAYFDILERNAQHLPSIIEKPTTISTAFCWSRGCIAAGSANGYASTRPAERCRAAPPACRGCPRGAPLQGAGADHLQSGLSDCTTQTLGGLTMKTSPAPQPRTTTAITDVMHLRRAIGYKAIPYAPDRYTPGGKEAWERLAERDPEAAREISDVCRQIIAILAG